MTARPPHLVPAAFATLAISAASVTGCSAPSAGREPTGAASSALSSGLVISEIYGGGGNSGASFASDFVEFFNRGTTPASLAGMSLQYAAPTAGFSLANLVPLPAVDVPAGGYFLVQLGAAGASGAALPTPDATGTVSVAASGGKVALVAGTTPLACDAGICDLAGVVDLVGYGASASQFEGATPADAPSGNAASVQRRGEGCVETDENGADFESPPVTATPRNSAAPALDCTTVAADAASDAAADGDAADAASDAPAVDAGAVKGLVISQAYGGGGNASAAYTNDFVEILNTTAGPLPLGGLSVQYASATSAFAAGDVVALPDVSLGAGQRFLIELASGGGAGAALPAPDLSSTGVNLAASAGKVALVAGTAPLGCGGADAGCTPDAIVDLVGWGSTATVFEGSGPAHAPTNNAGSVQRRVSGCVDTDDNAADFEAPTLAAAPRNTASPAIDCAGAIADAGSQDAATDAAADADVDAPADAAIGNVAGLVISQIYGGGGNSSASFTNDFVELFNRGSADVSLAGLSLQYASSASAFQASNVTPLPAATIPPGGYFLVQLASGGASGAALPSPDHTGTTGLSGSAGKVAIAIGTAALGCGAADAGCSPSGVVDLVGYGSGVTAYEGSGPAAGPGNNATSVQRKGAGCVDSDDNAADFAKLAAAPRSSATSIHGCAAPVDAGADAEAGAVDAGADGGAGHADAAAPDASDGAAAGDAAGDAATDDGGKAVHTRTPEEEDSGCSCATAGRGASRSPLGALGAASLLALAALRRRRARVTTR